MAIFNIKINNFVINDTWTVQRTYEELPEGLTFAKIYFTVKVDHSDADNSVIQKFITPTLTSTGEITKEVTTGGTLEFYVKAAHTDTAALIPNFPYVYDIQGIDSNGNIYTFEVGIIVPKEGVTTAVI